MKITKDGNMWHLSQDEFSNLMESESIFITDQEMNNWRNQIVGDWLDSEIVRIGELEKQAGNSGDYEEADAYRIRLQSLRRVKSEKDSK